MAAQSGERKLAADQHQRTEIVTLSIGITQQCITYKDGKFAEQKKVKKIWMSLAISQDISHDRQSF